MKIAHVVPYFSPKLGYQEYYLAKYEKDAGDVGNDVCVITSDREYPGLVHYFFKHRIIPCGVRYEQGVLTYRLPSVFESASLPNATIVRGLKEALFRFRTDIVHAHSALDILTLLVCFWKKDIGYKLVVDLHVLPVFSGSFSQLKHLYYMFYKNFVFTYLIAGRVDSFLAISPAVFRWFIKELHVPPSKVYFTPLGADTHLFKRNEKVRKLIRKRLGVKDDDVLIVYAGKIIVEKDVHVLVRALCYLAKKYENLKLLLIGAGDERYTAKLLSVARAGQALDRIILKGFIPHHELYKYYSASDIGVWPGSPSITIIEAMSTGLPIVIAKTDLTSHLLANGNGYNFDGGNWKELSRSLEKLIASGELRQEMGLKSRELVVRKLSWDVISKQTLEIYKNIARARR